MSETSYMDRLPLLERFEDVAATDRYIPAPDDWLICVTDVVGSTKAIGEGRYKAVNMAGASAISALMNALPDVRIPFFFGGDGAAALVPGEAEAAAESALAATRVFCAEELDLGLRAGLIRVGEVREAGHDVRAARLQVTPLVAYTMFAGGGMTHAEDLLKSGEIAVPEAPPGTRPDLTGLSCRWAPIRARSGAIVSLVIDPAPDGDRSAYDGALQAVLARLARLPRGGHPVAEDGPPFTWPPQGLALEAHARRGSESFAAMKRKVAIETLIAWVIDRLGVTIAGFSPRHYTRTTGRNSDFRKVADGLRVTVDCDDAAIADLAAILEPEQAAGNLVYGLVRQDAAVMTCIVPSFMTDDHMHFIDGAGGGYAGAAAAIKAGASS